MVVLAFVDECCLNQTSERSRSLMNKQFLKKKDFFYSKKFTSIMNEIMNIHYIERYTFD